MPGIGGIDHVPAGRVRNPHNGDVPVAIQVFGPIFVHSAVVVPVPGLGVGPAAILHGGEHGLGPIGVQTGEEVEDPVRQDSLDRLLTGVAREVPDGLQRELATHQVVALQIAHHQDPWAFIQRDPGRISHPDHPDIAPLQSLSQGFHGGLFRSVHHTPEFPGECLVIEVGSRLPLPDPGSSQGHDQDEGRPSQSSWTADLHRLGFLVRMDCRDAAPGSCDQEA